MVSLATVGCKKGASSELTTERCEAAAKRAFKMLETSGEMSSIQRMGAEAGTVQGCKAEPDNADRVRYIECLEKAANGPAVSQCQSEWQASQAKRTITGE